MIFFLRNKNIGTPSNRKKLTITEKFVGTPFNEFFYSNNYGYFRFIFSCLIIFLLKEKWSELRKNRRFLAILIDLKYFRVSENFRIQLNRLNSSNLESHGVPTKQIWFLNLDGHVVPTKRAKGIVEEILLRCLQKIVSESPTCICLQGSPKKFIATQKNQHPENLFTIQKLS
jgi:hypothetical protein